MGAALYFFDANGNLTVDLSRRIFRVLKTVNTGTSNGSTTVNDSTYGTVGVIATSGGGAAPTFSVSGGTVSWSFDGIDPGDRASVTAVIGAY